MSIPENDKTDLNDKAFLITALVVLVSLIVFGFVMLARDFPKPVFVILVILAIIVGFNRFVYWMLKRGVDQ